MVKPKKIYCMHHSHLDVGYTHPQELILELQEAYIDQAIDICSRYKSAETPMRWTIEAALPLIKWLEDAGDPKVEELRKLIHQKLISVAALPMHTTPLNDAYQLKKLLEYKNEVEQKLGISITAAVNHDVNGQPWSFGDILLDAGVSFYLTGENIHFGGIPFPRPKAFYWETPSKKKVLSYLGEHYSLFSQFLQTDKRDLSLMKEGLDKYNAHLEEKGIDQDFIFLTATTPPLMDNNSPDFLLYDLVQEFNQVYPEYSISFITPEILRDEILSQEQEIETIKGDWTDFWNFGAGSTPNEVKYSKIANQNIKKASYFEAISGDLGRQYKRVKQAAILNSLLYNEHTWGASGSVDKPFELESIAGKVKKQNYCYDALSQSAFILNQAMDSYLNVPPQLEKIEAVSFTNTSCFQQEVVPKIDDELFSTKPYLSALKTRQHLHGEEGSLAGTSFMLQPFETKFVPISQFRKPETQEIPISKSSENVIETPFYRIVIDGQNGVVKSIRHLKLDWEIADNSTYGFFDLVIETIDESRNPNHRSTFFPRDIELANYSISVWNHEWKGLRKKYLENPILQACRTGFETVIEADYSGKAGSVSGMKKRFVFSENSDEIKVAVTIKKEDMTEPNSLYLTLPINLDKDWESVFESADTLVKLDEEQLGAVSKDWVTIGNTIAFFDQEKGICLGTSDSPLIQLDGFAFGRESKKISRNANPLFLSWIYNNYWNTNFSATEHGLLKLEYTIAPFKNYSASEQVKLGVEVDRPIERSWTAVSSAIEMTAPFEIDLENCVILAIEKQEDETIQFFFKNYSEEKGSFALRFKENAPIESYLTNISGKKEAGILFAGESIGVETEPNCFYYLTVKM